MAIKVMSSTFNGIDGVLITVEVDLTRGLPNFNIVGLADISVKESKERVRSAIINSGFEFPIKRITVNLAPADIRKEGSLFDLPIAIGILAATSQIKVDLIDEHIFIGELSLSGEINRVKGVLPIVMEGIKNRIYKFTVPTGNASECSVIKGAFIFPFETLKQVVHYMNYNDVLPCKPIINVGYVNIRSELDFSDVSGQESCKRALEIAASGGHNMIMFGPPGSGKTMLAQRLPTILPELSYEEALEVTKIYSVSGNLNACEGLIKERPFRSPHHTTSKIALIGGGSNLIPGEISLAHNGVLFLDEILEFKKDVLEVLRQPLEDRCVTISRCKGTVKYPSNFMLIASLNPCPCGFLFSEKKQCICTDYERKRYLSKLSGPLLDRIDIFSYASPPSFQDLNLEKTQESSEKVRKRVEKARHIQFQRFASYGLYCNAQMNSKMLRVFCKLDKKSTVTIENFFLKHNLSTRAYTRILKVARTIADLYENANIMHSDIIEALQYREFFNEKFI